MRRIGIISIILAAAVAVVVLLITNGSDSSIIEPSPKPTPTPIIVDQTIVEEEVEYEQSNDPLYITGAVIGMDASGALTDVMMVGVFNTENYNIDVFAIPRDTRITLSDELHETINATIWSPQTMKLTDLYWRVKKAKLQNPIQYTVNTMEQILGIPIDNYITVDTESFDQVIDALGGLDLYVPMDMNYEDPYQNLYIHLREGYQHLDGDQAEQLVRYRSSYSDLARIEMQQYVIKRSLEELLNLKDWDKVFQVTKAVYNMVETDINIMDIPKYAKYYKHISLENIDNFHTIPGVNKKVDGIWYFTYEDQAAIYEFVGDCLKDENSIQHDSKDYTIQIMNGSGKHGIANKYKEQLIQEGYTVGSVGDSNELFHQKTQIIVKEAGLGHDLKNFFTLSEVIVDEARIPEGSDIVIIVGGLEK